MAPTPDAYFFKLTELGFSEHWEFTQIERRPRWKLPHDEREGSGENLGAGLEGAAVTAVRGVTYRCVGRGPTQNVWARDLRTGFEYFIETGGTIYGCCILEEMYALVERIENAWKRHLEKQAAA